MANNLGAGQNLILASSSTGPGNWFRRAAPDSAPSFQATLNAAAAGGAASVNIECSNDGLVSCATVLGSINLAAAPSTGYGDGFATLTGWEYYRASLQSISTGSVSVTASINKVP